MAKLANLSISDKLITKLTPQLAEILEFVGQLEQVDTSKVDPTAEVTGLTNIHQEERPAECLPQTQVLNAAARIQNGYIVVKGVFAPQDA